MRRVLGHDLDEIAEALEPAEPSARRPTARELALSVPAVVVCGHLLLGALVWAGVGTPLRTGLALALALFGSGLSLLAVIAPPSSGFDGLERVALGAVLSLAVGGLLGLALARTPATLTVTSLLAGALVFNAGCLAGLAFRRRDGERPRPVRLPGGWWHDQGRSSRLLAVALALALAGGVWAFGHSASTAGSEPPMTEFFVDDPGLASEPVRRGAPLIVRWGVVNREGTAATYRIRALVEGREIGRISGLRLRDGETRTGAIDLSLPEAARPGEAGASRLNLILDRDGRPHRRLQLWIETTQEGATDRETS